MFGNRLVHAGACARGARRRTRMWLCLLIICPALLAAGCFGAGGAERVFPGATWQFKKPADVGMDAAKLKAFSDFLGGRGCVVRHGQMVYTWGDQSQKEDVASAAKPVYAHFLFKAVEEGRIPSLDAKVVKCEPRLGTINAALGYKDRNITWRHMANQISCYGVSEAPGTAYDYNDYQMALFWDSMMKKVYGATFENVDKSVLHPRLTDLIGCQDSPTLMAFGANNRPGRLGISVRDFARFGLLYLNKGNWKGKQVISKEHAVMAVTSPLPNSIPRTTAREAEMISGQRSIGGLAIPDDHHDHFGSYSWLWWTNGVSREGKRHWPAAPLDTYGAFGHANGKRSMVVIPSLDMVVSWNDSTLDQRTGNPVNDALKLLMASVKEIPGQIVVDSTHPQWLKRSGGGPFFMCGPGDPEGFLYRGKRRPDGTRDGDQMELINKLKGTGANCIYLMAVRSHGGDGDKTQNPYVDSDPTKEFDQNILDQWETWFTEMDGNGIAIFFYIYDDSCRIWDTGDVVGPSEKRLINELVDRFEHHKNLIWCVAEEYGEALTPARARNIAAEIRAADDHHHPIAIHLNDGLDFSEFADDPNIDQFAIQYNRDTATELHAGMVKAWKDAAGRYNLNMAEADKYGTGATLRQKNWAVAMGGAYAMILWMDIKSTPIEDLKACGRTVRFFESTNFNEMAPRDDLAFAGTQYVLAKPGGSYIAYASNLVGKMGLKSMTAGAYDLRWYDIVRDKYVRQSKVTVKSSSQSWAKPAGFGNEVALYIQRVNR